MPPARKADVIVVANRASPSNLASLERVLKCSGPELNRLIVLCSADPALDRLAHGDPRVVGLNRAGCEGDVLACNRGLLEREGDAVLLAAGAVVTHGWLSELRAVAHSEERTAFAWPLSIAGPARAAAPADDGALAEIDQEAATKAFSGLPESTATPSVEVGCVYLRGQVLDAIGLLDAGLATRQSAIDDWVMRAGALGFFGKRANHAYLHFARGDGAATEVSLLNLGDRAVLDQRHPHFSHQVMSFNGSLDGRLARHALDFVRTGKLRVAYDLRHMPRECVGTETYAFNLAKALSRLPQLELSFLVNSPAQAQGLDGPIIISDEWRDEFAVIHKPAQFFPRQDLAILFGSSAHVVITYQDLNSDRVPTVFGDDADERASRASSGLSMLCAQAILARSDRSRQQVALELGIPDHEIAVMPLNVETEALSTFEGYRAAVLRPSDRSLQMRRMLREAILSWSQSGAGLSFALEGHAVASNDRAVGVRMAWKTLNAALKRRAGREWRRLHLAKTRMGA